MNNMEMPEKLTSTHSKGWRRHNSLHNPEEEVEGETMETMDGLEELLHKLDMMDAMDANTLSASSMLAEKKEETTIPSPGYLRPTFSQTMTANPQFVESQRLQNTYRSHTWWSVKQLPNTIEPGTIEAEMKTRALKNQLGAMFTNGPDGVGIHSFKVGGIYSDYFNPLSYVPNDFDKPNLLRKAQLEEERNLNASFSKKPFKTSEYVKVVPPVPHDFGVNKKSTMKKIVKAIIKEEEDDIDLDILFDLNEDEDDEVDSDAKKRQVHRRLNQLQLGNLVRDEYSADAKSKFIAGHFQLGRGNVIGTSSQPRLELRKTVQLMKSWITEIYSILDQEWPYLNFKMCIDGNTKGRESVDTIPEDVTYTYDALGSAFITRKGSSKTSQKVGASRKGSSLASPLSNAFSPTGDSSLSPMPSPFKLASLNTEPFSPNGKLQSPSPLGSPIHMDKKHNGAVLDFSKLRTDQILVQFETDNQILPPLNALSKYMNHLVLHGKAGELGLRRRSDRWGTLEYGLIKAPVLSIETDLVVVRIEECRVVKKVRKNSAATKTSSSSEQNSVKQSFTSLLEKDKAMSTGKNGQFDVSLNLTNGDQTSSIEEDAASKRVLLYKHVPYGPMTEKSSARTSSIKNKGSIVTEYNIPTLVTRAINQAKVDHQLLSPTQRIQQDIDDATAAAVAAATAVMSTAYGIRRTSVLLTARGDGKGVHQKGGSKERRESRGSTGMLASVPRPSSMNAGSDTSRTPTKSRSVSSVKDGSSFNTNAPIVVRPKVLMHISVEGRRTEKEPSTGIPMAVYDLNGRKSTEYSTTAATPLSSEPRELIDRKFNAVYEENSGAWEMAISLSEHFQKLLHQSHSAEDDDDDDKTSVTHSIVSESEAGTSASSSNSPLTRGNSAVNSEKQQEARRFRAEAMNVAISGNVSKDEVQGSDHLPKSTERENGDNKNRSTSEQPGENQGGKENDRDESLERGVSMITVTAILTGRWEEEVAPIDSTIPTKEQAAAATSTENSFKVVGTQKVGDDSSAPGVAASTVEPTPLLPVDKVDSLTQENPSIMATSTPSATSSAGNDVDLTASSTVGDVSAGTNPSANQSYVGLTAEQQGLGSNGLDDDEMSIDAVIRAIDQKSVQFAVADDAASINSNSNSNSPVSINTRLRALMKESRTSVVYGKELTNIRSHRQRAKEEAKIAKDAIATQAVEDARVVVHSTKQRKITLKLLLRPGEDTIELGSHCVSAILRAAGLPDLKGLFTRRVKSSDENGDNSSNNSRSMSSANLSLHQAALSTRGSEESQGQSFGSSTNRKMSLLRGRASFGSTVTAALLADSTKNNTPVITSRGVQNSRSAITTPVESPRLAPFSANQHTINPTEEKKVESSPSPSKQPMNMLNVSTKQGFSMLEPVREVDRYSSRTNTEKLSEHEMRSRKSAASSGQDSSDESSAPDPETLLNSLSNMSSTKSFKESMSSKGSVLGKSSKSTKQLTFRDSSSGQVNEAGGGGGLLTPLDESTHSDNSGDSPARAGNGEGDPHLTPFRPSALSIKTDDNRVEIKPPNPFLSKSMKGSFSKSLTALGAVKEDLKMKKVIEVANANMALGISSKTPLNRSARSTGVLAQSSKEPTNPSEDIAPAGTIPTIPTTDDGLKDPQLTPFIPPEPIVKTDSVKSPNPFLTRSMRGSFSKSLTMLEIVKEDNPSVVTEAAVSTRSHSAPPIGGESSKDLNKAENEDSIKLLNMSSRMNSLSLLQQSSKEPNKMLTSGDVEGDPHLTPFRPAALSIKTGDKRVEIKPPNPFLSKSMRGNFSKSLTALEVVKEDLMMKKAMEVVNANMALGLSVKMPTEPTFEVSSRRALQNMNRSSKELDIPSLRTSSRYPSEKSTIAGDGVNAALTYLNASISAQQRESEKRKDEQQKAMALSGRLMDLVMELEMVCEDEAGEGRISLDQNPAINSAVNSTKHRNFNVSMKELRRKEIEKSLGLDDTVLEDDHSTKRDSSHKVAATTSSALPPPGMNLFSNPKAISADTATPGLTAKLEQLFSQQQSNSLFQLQQDSGSIKSGSPSVKESLFPDTSSGNTSTKVTWSTPPPVNRGNSALLFSSNSAKQSTKENSMKKSITYTRDSSAQSSLKDSNSVTIPGPSVQPTRKSSYKEFSYLSTKMDELSAAAGVQIAGERHSRESSSSKNDSMLSTARTDNKGPGQGQVSGYATPTTDNSSHSTSLTPLSSATTRGGGGGGFSHMLAAPAATGVAGISSGPPSSSRGVNPPNTLNPLNKQMSGTTSPISRDDRHIGPGPAVARKEEIYEIRADGMQVARLLTFAMYAPWVQITQVSAAKHTGNEIRGMVRKHREEEEQAQHLLHQRMKSELFGSPTVPHRISQIVLARDGGMSEVKYLFPEVVGEIEATVSELILDRPQRSGRNKSINEMNSTYVTDLLTSGNAGSSVRKSSSGIPPHHHHSVGGGSSSHGNSHATSRASSQSPTKDHSVLASRHMLHGPINQSILQFHIARGMEASPTLLSPALYTSNETSSTKNQAGTCTTPSHTHHQLISALHAMNEVDNNPYLIKALLKPTQPVSGKRSASSKPTPTGEKYRTIRERKLSATDQAGVVMGRRNLQKVNDLASSGMLMGKSADRWRK